MADAEMLILILVFLLASVGLIWVFERLRGS